MADNKTVPNIGAGAGFFAKRVQKSLNRAQEKVMQKLGKTMETRDEHFEHSLQNLIKQQSDGGRLLKDVRTYFTAVKAMHESSRRLSQTLTDVYEPGWQGGEDLPVIMESEDLLWNDYEEKLADQIVRTMENYNSQFSDIKERVAKRGRKLVDYDSSRHHLEALQNAKKKDEGKTTKAEEEFNKAQSVFEEINKELREELPLLYQSRIGCYVTVFQNISNLRDVFYKEMSKLNHELYNVIKKLETQHSGKSFIIKGLNSSKSTRKSLVISAPIPCNTAFPADHTSIHASSAPNGKDSASSAQPQSISEELTQEDGNICITQSLSDSDEHSSTGADTPKRQSVCDNKNFDSCDVTNEGPSRPESLIKEEDQVSIQSEGPVQVSSQSKDATSPEVSPPISMESNMPAPQPEEKISEAEPEQNTELPLVPAKAGDNYQNPPGFLYKAVALESSGEGQLQFKKGDVILVLADTEEKEGVVRGVTEESWIQHRDLADHADAFPDKLIQRV